MKAREVPDVRPGQVWADNDWRCEGRTLRVVEILRPELGLLSPVLCVTVTDSTKYPPERPRVGKETKVRLDRFRPTSTGYCLLQDA